MSDQSLADQIEAMRARAVAEHHSMMMRVSDLDSFMANADGVLMRALNSLIDGQARRGADIRRALTAIQARLGPTLSNGPAFNPTPADSANGIEGRYAPPMRSVSTSGDASGLYDRQ